MGGDGAHGVVGDASGCGAAHPGRIGQERVEPAVAALWSSQFGPKREFLGHEGGSTDGRKAYIVQIEVYATVMCQDEVADCICSLDGLSVVVKGAEEPGVLGCNQFA